MTNLRGKMASNEVIERNITTLVELDRKYWALLASRDRDGLIELAEVAAQRNQSCVARKSRDAARDM